MVGDHSQEISPSHQIQQNPAKDTFSLVIIPNSSWHKHLCTFLEKLSVSFLGNVRETWKLSWETHLSSETQQPAEEKRTVGAESHVLLMRPGRRSELVHAPR